MTSTYKIALAEITTKLVAAYVAENSVSLAELPALIASVYGALDDLGKMVPEAAQSSRPTPPVSIKRSITNEYLVSLEDGKHYVSLKRHLAKHGLTPTEYRVKWGLPFDYPMVASAFAAKRSELARTLGLGRKGRGEAEG